MNTPQATMSIAGFRSWAMGLGYLWSPRGPGRVRWPRSEPLRAICTKHSAHPAFPPVRGGHQAPELTCTCGIYGAYDPWDIELGEQKQPWSLIVGRVEGWGRVALGARGFRAELARPVELVAEPWWTPNLERAARNVALAYGVPLVSWEDALARTPVAHRL
jgi:hypothetical protein